LHLFNLLTQRGSLYFIGGGVEVLWSHIARPLSPEKEKEKESLWLKTTHKHITPLTAVPCLKSGKHKKRDEKRSSEVAIQSQDGPVRCMIRPLIEREFCVTKAILQIVSSVC